MGPGMKIHKLEQYTLTRISTGSLCTSYHARHKHDNLPDLLIKIMHESASRDPILRLRFYDETSLLQTVHHAQIPRLVSTGVHEGRPYSVCQYIHGTSLRELITANRIGYHSIPDITAQMLTIIWHLHNRLEPVVHSDISPENILLDRNHRVYLIDYGCAQSIRRNETGATGWVAKPAYMSPEQARGMPWNQRSDLYQIGLVIYEMYTGEKRNRGNTIRDMIPLAAEPEPAYLEGVPEIMADLVYSLLTEDAAFRGSTAKDYLDLLNNSKFIRDTLASSCV